MTADVELLPCAKCGMPCRAGEYHPFAACLMFKACHNSETVRANIAPLQAENERLRAEVERLRADRDSWEQQASDRVADWHAEHLRAERLAEALEEIRSCSTMNLAMQPDPSALTARLGDIHQIAGAALSNGGKA